MFGNAIGNDLSGVDAYRQGQAQWLKNAVAQLPGPAKENYDLLLARGLSPADAEGTRIALTPVSSNGTPIPWYQDYNPDTMFALHSIVEVTHALNYQLTQLMGQDGGTSP